MTPHPFDVEPLLRQHGYALRRLAVELLGDSASADDALQEVWLRAVRRPPRHERSVGGWLATMVKNVASSLRRGERRRAARDTAVAKARGDEVEDHASVLARQELAHRLVTAVSALEAPFRDVIWQRYFEGMAPREIASASGVPVATVKSRLQRGLVQLRERLGQKGSDWRGALAVAFGLEGNAVPAGAAVTATTAWSGVLLMTAWTKTVAAIVVVGLAGVLWWSVHDAPANAPRADVAVPDAGSAQLVAGTEGQPIDRAAAPLAERTAAPPAMAAAAAPTATVRGRCVDDRGAPIVGCAVELVSILNTRLMEAWQREHGSAPAPQWPPPQSTGPDGAFVFEFAPLPPYEFDIRIERDAFAAMSCRLGAVAPAAVVELGDIVLGAGIRVAGKVVDQAGQPIAAAHVTLQRVGTSRAMQAVPRSSSQITADASGAFTLPDWLAPGSYEPNVRDCDVVSPRNVELTARTTFADLTLVVRRWADAPAIRGRVVDDADRPVAKARVQYDDPVRPGGTSTDADGRFVLRQRMESIAKAVTLFAELDGYEPTRSETAVPWGTSDVLFRLQRSGGLTIRVTDEAGAPVPDYSVRVLDPRLGGLGSRREAKGPFADGVARLPGVPAGKCIVLVDFVDASLARAIEPVEVTPRGPNLLAVRARRAAQRTLRVVHSDGSPVAATRVQLCTRLGGTFSEATHVFREERWLLNLHQDAALALFEGATDAAGRISLRGPGDRDLGLRILGPGHAPCVLPSIRLDAADELVVTVQRGARLVGRIGPTEVLAELRRQAGVAEGAEYPADRQPSLRLRGAGRAMYPPPQRGSEEGGRALVAVGADGTFDIAGLPAGRWQVELVHWRAEISQGGGGTKSMPLGEVLLADDVPARLEADLSALLPGRLEGEVTVNGEPVARGLVTLQPVYGTRADGHPDGDWINLQTDASGRFAYEGRAGVYSLIVQHRVARRSAVPHLRSHATATVVRGATTRCTFAVMSGTLRLRVLDSAGAPVGGIEVITQPDAQRLPLTDADGRTEAELTAQAVTLRVLPKRAQSREAQTKAWNDGIAAGLTDPFEPLFVTLGNAEIEAGRTTALELRLPPEWAK